MIAEPASSEIPFVDFRPAHHELRQLLDQAWRRVTSSETYIGGNAVREFERRWARTCDRAEAVGVGSGTDALELALRARGIGPGDEVIVPSMTFVATAAAVRATGADVVYVDVEPDTLLVSLRLVEAAVTARTAAVVPVHLYGNPVPEMDRIAEVGKRQGIFVLEDAAQAHGASIGGRPVGSWGDAAAFSFYPSKNLGAFGDGGAVVTDDRELAERVRRMGSHGRSTEGAFDYVDRGTTSRLDALQAAILDAKLDHLERWNTSRREILSWYRELLPPELQPVGCHVGTPAPHLCVVLVRNRDEVRARLAASGIGTGVHYHQACHQTKAVGTVGLHLPVSEAAAQRALSLPLFPHLQRHAVERVCRELVTAVGNGEG